LRRIARGGAPRAGRAQRRDAVGALIGAQQVGVPGAMVDAPDQALGSRCCHAGAGGTVRVGPELVVQIRPAGDELQIATRAGRSGLAMSARAAAPRR